jgi:hypothetical protein
MGLANQAQLQGGSLRRTQRANVDRPGLECLMAHAGLLNRSPRRVWACFTGEQSSYKMNNPDDFVL